MKVIVPRICARAGERHAHVGCEPQSTRTIHCARVLAALSMHRFRDSRVQFRLPGAKHRRAAPPSHSDSLDICGPTPCAQRDLLGIRMRDRQPLRCRRRARHIHDAPIGNSRNRKPGHRRQRYLIIQGRCERRAGLSQKRRRGPEPAPARGAVPPFPPPMRRGSSSAAATRSSVSENGAARDSRTPGSRKPFRRFSSASRRGSEFPPPRTALAAHRRRDLSHPRSRTAAHR